MLVGISAVCGFVGELLGDAIRHPIEDRQLSMNLKQATSNGSESPIAAIAEAAAHIDPLELLSPEERRLVEALRVRKSTPRSLRGPRRPPRQPLHHQQPGAPEALPRLHRRAHADAICDRLIHTAHKAIHLVPQLATRWPDATTAQVTVDAELPPLVRASTTTNDLTIELGDLMVDLSIEGTRIFRFGVNLTLRIDLVPTAGKLSPIVVDVVAEVALLDKLYDGPDAALELAVKIQIGSAAAAMLGDSAAIALPDLPGLGAPTDVVPDARGRYLRVKL